MKIIQFHSGITCGDAITNQILLLDKIFRKNNFDSDIYGEYISEELKYKTKDINSISCSPNDLLIIHHSIGNKCFNKIINLKCKKILIYHNITPSKYIYDEGTRKSISDGYAQVKNYLKYVDCAIADSNYNRKCLISFGYKNVKVLPIQVSIDRFDKIDANQKILNSKKKAINLLFVGRIIPNKRQLDLVKMFAIYNKTFNKNSFLYLVGDIQSNQYKRKILNYCFKNGISSNVIFTGKVTEEELKAYYQIADIFVCMSEHEGFCVPLLEAMKMNLPVIATKSSAIEEVMSDAGILFLENNLNYIASMCDEIIKDSELKQSIISSQLNRLKKLNATDTEKLILEIINNVLNEKDKPTIQIQGPFETTYSLARVNKFLAKSLNTYHNDYSLSIYTTEGPGDYIPKKEDLNKDKEAADLYLKSKNITFPNVTIRNLYPPRVYDANGELNFLYFYWEESYIPKDYINNFNEYLDGIGASSEYVAETLKLNGLKIPISVVGSGVTLCENFESFTPYKLKTKKEIKFLHISSAFPRKGIDVLIEGYYRAFTKKDNVCMVLKTFDNIHNNVKDILEKMNKKYVNHPEVEWINVDLSEEKINSLYKACTCYVHMARGEGFGLPVAEAMLAKIPTIVCNNSGLSDFATPQTSITVSYKREIAKSHISNGESTWFEPDINDYCEKLKFFVKNYASKEIRLKVENAYLLIKDKFNWKCVSDKWINFINETYRNSKKPSVGLITSWNTKCGIAEYSRMQVENSLKYAEYHIFPSKTSQLLKEDEYFVDERLWKDRNDSNVDELIERLKTDSCEIVHIHFNWGFFNLNNLENIILKLHKTKKIVITFHAINDVKGDNLKRIRQSLNLCSALIVHKQDDAETLKSFRINKNIIYVVPLGQIIYPYLPIDTAKKKFNLQNKFVIGSYGFLLPHKGIYDMLETINDLKIKHPNLHYMIICSLYNCPESTEYYQQCKKFIDKYDLNDFVTLVTDYLNDDESINYLKACDVMIAPYHNTKESASGAARFLFATWRPVITSTSPIFDEFKDYSYQFTCEDKEQLKDTIQLFIEDKEKCKYYEEKTKEFVMANSWEKIVRKIVDIYKNL